MTTRFNPIPRPVVIQLEGEENWSGEVLFSANNQRINREDVIPIRDKLKTYLDEEKKKKIKSLKKVALTILIVSAWFIILYFASETKSYLLVCSESNDCHYVTIIRRFDWSIPVGIVVGLIAAYIYWRSWKIRLTEFEKVRSDITELNNTTWRNRGLEWSLCIWDSTVELKKSSTPGSNITLQTLNDNPTQPLVCLLYTSPSPRDS
eukprot:TRINITY_DN1479_c0_g3_i1.p1 TRINITY_DN1479_c0_g3~~TRINITY_DN1479_c0_g3_i1.p1  ORF type:complete len:206 (-),score=30.46 TRINITY_DN1479_c0_g3_i1:26-643(-)